MGSITSAGIYRHRMYMETCIYTIGNGGFREWIDGHPECRRVRLEGRLVADKHCWELVEIEKALYEKRIEAIDISNLDAKEFDDCCMAAYGYGTDEDWDEMPERDGQIDVMLQMVQNIEYATDFVWCGDSLLSGDLRVLICQKPAKSVIVPETVEVIGKSAFFEKEGLERVVLPKNIKVVDDYAFAYCYGLYFERLPDTLRCIGKWAFQECGFGEIAIPDGIEEVAEGSFAWCMPTKISIPPTVKRIGAHAFEHCASDVWLPEGVEEIGPCAFGDVRLIHIPTTAREIDRQFYYDEDGYCRVPYVDVAIGNKLFYDLKGSLYKVDDPEPYLGCVYEPRKEDTLLLPTSEFARERQYSIEELKELYYTVSPVDSEERMFHVWNGKERYANIVDRYGNEYLNKKLVKDIQVSFDHFIIVNNSYVYSIDMRGLLLSADMEEYRITGCDDEGRIYVMVGDEVDEFYAPLFPNAPLPQCWCIDVTGKPLLGNRYNGLGRFDGNGYAPACMGKLWGMIDRGENVVIPYAYKSIEPFDNEGMALAKKGSKYGYVGRDGETIRPFMYDFFYKKFEDGNYAYAEIYKGKNAGEYFVGRRGEILGKFQPRDKYEAIYEPGFHIIALDGKYGYCKQFALGFSGCIYRDIRVIDENQIEVSEDGISYQQVKHLQYKC